MMNGLMNRWCILAMVALGALTLSGCGGVTSFPVSAKVGETISVATGWTTTFDRLDLTVTFTDSNGDDTVIAAGDPAIRAVINLYPDPLSYMVVGTRTGYRKDYRGGKSLGSLASRNHTDFDPDLYQTIVFVDLPVGLSEGIAEVIFSYDAGEAYGPVSINVLPGTGTRTEFVGEGGLDMNDDLLAMERTPHHTIDFTGDATNQLLAESIEVTLTHDPDKTAGGSGRAFAVNPRVEMKNLFWSDDGITMKVFMTRASSLEADLDLWDYKFFKFYVTGDVTGVSVATVSAFDIDGNPIIGVAAQVRVP